MALLYPWATKEYLLWNMSLCQIVLYHNLGIDMKYPKQPGKNGDGDQEVASLPSLKDMDKRTAREKVQEARKIMADMRVQEEWAASEKRKEPYRQIYGDV
tara:strand:+ start:1958 stop:2257 length:300 start_codon:yes stop_codon:yes gene_type:complete